MGDGAATERDDAGLLVLDRFFQRGEFEVPERGFPKPIEDNVDRPVFSHDERVEIEEADTQAIREFSADRRLARAHEAVEGNVPSHASVGERSKSVSAAARLRTRFSSVS